MRIQGQNLHFSYSDRAILQNFAFDFPSGQHIWIKGASGSGKSTFLRILAGLLVPNSGQIRYENQAVSDLSESERSRFRFENLGFVHQENHLIEHWTLRQNLNLADSTLSRQLEALQAMGLSHLNPEQVVSTFSGGERQRLALARLILQNPKVALVDEPTSHLDDENTEKVLTALTQKLKGSTVLVVSHDLRLQKFPFSLYEFRGAQ